jgi:hypothetical protein
MHEGAGSISTLVVVRGICVRSDGPRRSLIARHHALAAHPVDLRVNPNCNWQCGAEALNIGTDDG